MSAVEASDRERRCGSALAPGAPAPNAPWVAGLWFFGCFLLSDIIIFAALFARIRRAFRRIRRRPNGRRPVR